MSKFTFENAGNNTYLVYQLNEKDELDSLSLGMITNNRIGNIAPILFTQMDSDRYLKYNITAKISVKQFFNGAVNKKRLLGVFSGIASAIINAEEYMIDTSLFVLDLDYIFADVSTCETILVCLPVVSKSPAALDLASFFKSIVFSTQFDQTENCDYVAKIISYLNGNTSFSLSEFRTMINQFQDGLSQPSIVQPQAPNGSAASVFNAAVPVQSAVSQPVQQPVAPPMPMVQQPKQIVQPHMPVPQTKKPPQGFAVPDVQKAAKAPAPKPDGNQQDISFFYLMQHYNKENAAAYKAQKELKKDKPQKTKPQKSKKAAQPEASPNVGFSVPGQPQTSFAIPGVPQQAAVPVLPAVTQASDQAASVQPGVHQPIPQVQVQQVPPAVPAFVHQNTANYGETTVLGGGNAGETTILSQAAANINNPHLIRQKNNEKIMLNTPVFRLGKEKSYVDYFIGDNAAISRSHANIINRDGKYFVIDTNSTNHTYVNGTMLQCNAEVKLIHGAKIRLANEEFEFRLY